MSRLSPTARQLLERRKQTLNQEIERVEEEVRRFNAQLDDSTLHLATLKQQRTEIEADLA